MILRIIASILVSFLFLAAFTIVAALYRLFTRSWLNEPPLQYNKFKNLAEFRIADIPTTYYQPGKLKDVLPQFHSPLSRSGFIHLYRVSNESTYDVDKSLFDFFVKVVPVEEYCDVSTTENSVICGGNCFITPPPQTLDVHANRDILESNSPPYYYATFAEVKNKSIPLELLRDLGAEHIAPQILLEQAFVSNFPVGYKTANLHATQIASSVAIQFIGSKTWLFSTQIRT